jgi:hypothetical protein
MGAWIDRQAFVIAPNSVAITTARSTGTASVIIGIARSANPNPSEHLHDRRRQDRRGQDDQVSGRHSASCQRPTSAATDHAVPASADRNSEGPSREHTTGQSLRGCRLRP